MTTPTLRDWQAALPDLKRVGKQWEGPCPGCGEGHNRFHITEKDGRALVGCRYCLDGRPEDIRRKRFWEIVEMVFPDRKPSNGTNRARRTEFATYAKGDSDEALKPGSRDNPFWNKDPATLSAALYEMGRDVRFNVRTMRIEWSFRAAHFQTWKPLNDRQTAELRYAIKNQFYVETKDGPRPLYFGRDLFADVLNALLCHREIDPLLKRLESLPRWDGTARLEGMLCNVLGAPWSSLAEWASVAILLGVIQRALEPGCKLDEIVVLIGPQGIGKSSLLRELFWPDMQELFGDGLQWDAPAKVQVESFLGRAIVEATEMVGRGRAEIENMKAVITRQDDGAVRLPYARSTEPLPRRCIIVGTTNNQTDLPNDPSGNRRFVPIELGKGCHVESWMDECRDQLWAEALHMYGEGRRANLDRELYGVQREAVEVHRDRDDLIEDAVALLGEGPYRLARIVEELGDAAKGVALARIVKALKNAGWQSRRTATERLWERTGHDT